ncbi:MAG: universal stress protein, partial [Alphaproteobacteria bacterium]
AERTIRAARHPVLMANGVPAGFYRHILIAVDFSECSRRAIQAVRDLGFHRQAAVSIIHVYDTPASSAVARALPVDDQIRDYLHDEKKQAAETLAAFLNDLEFSPDRQIVKFIETSESDAICSAAREVSADLITVGTHGRTGLPQIMLGSVAERVLRSADRDVLAVPPSAHP